jgi:hypothetical protein
MLVSFTCNREPRRGFPRGSVLLVCFLSLLVVGGSASLAAAADAPANDNLFQTQVRPFLQNFCADCHGPDDPSGGVALDLTQDLTNSTDTWFKALAALESRIMPPADAPQPTDEQRSRIIQWIEVDYAAEQCGKATEHAPVVMRRLNRDEYNNTIRDLIGLNLRPADDFPADEMSFGFDNIGSALTISPAHLEKYFDAADRVLQAAIQIPSPDGRSPLELVGLQTLDLKPGKPVEFESPFVAGDYLTDLVLLGPFQNTPAPVLEVGIGVDRRIVEPVVVQGRAANYRLWLTAAEGKQQVFVSLDESKTEKASVEEAKKDVVAGDGYRRGERGLTIESIVVRGPCVVSDLSDAQKNLLSVLPSLGERTREQAGQQAVARFAERAFRRPLRDGELDRLMAVFRMADRRGECFERSMQVALAAVLCSPQFLFLVEPEDSIEDRPLNDYELASRLSYFLWSSLPDEELLNEAAAGTLRTNLKSQVSRMLADAKSSALVHSVAGQWLQLRRLDGVAPDSKLFPDFDVALRSAMREETERFFDDIVRNDRSVLTLLDADYTYLNERLAKHYGIAGVTGDEFQRVALAGPERGGVLTQASILTLTSNPNRTSPVKRGQFILEQLLGTPPPPAPPNVPKLDEADEAAKLGSLRDRLEAHRANPECAACHQRMDPLGFALENYDAVGRWRATDGDFKVDPAGVLTDGRDFKTPSELKKLLTSQPKQFSRSLIRNLLTHALGRGLESSDWCTIEAIRRQLEADEYKFSAIIHGIVESDTFQTRGGREIYAEPDGD